MQTPLRFLDRADVWRKTPGILEQLRHDPRTRVIVVQQGKARNSGHHLVTTTSLALERAAAQDDPIGGVHRSERDGVMSLGGTLWALLGRSEENAALLVAAVPAEVPFSSADETWIGARDAGVLTGPGEPDVLVSAVSLAAWLHDSPYCSRCGTEACIHSAGWSRLCPGCGTEYFPRMDPAVIVAAQGPDGSRLLLGANAQWKGEVFSCFAGFVEAGESLEDALHRELREEAGVSLAEIRYRVSQPWPYPRSLMIGFRATVTDENDARADGEEILDVRWFTRAEIAAAREGDAEFRLPGPGSVSRSLIDDWFAG